MTTRIWVLALAAFVIALLTSALQLVGLLVAPLAALALGAAAGWWAAATGADGWKTAARAGLLVGIGALLGAMVGVGLPALLAGSFPGVQEFVQASEPHPEARIATEWIAPLAGLAGLMSGFVLGLGDLALALLGAVTAAALRNSSRPTGNAAS